MERQQNIMTYYWKKAIYDQDVIIARSYETSRGFVFDIGKAYDTHNPVSGIRDFFAMEHMCRENSRELKKEVEALKKKYKNTEIYTTEEPYR